MRYAGLRALLEHHNAASIVGTAPEILVAAIAGTTRRIRVGSAGVMLPHYSALKVAEQIRVLEAIAPGRIDLGVGRASGSDTLTGARALNPYSDVDEFPRQVQELQHRASGVALPEGHPYRHITAHPTGPTSPQLWILGGSGYGAQLAAHLGLPYASERLQLSEIVINTWAFGPAPRRHSHEIVTAPLDLRGAASAS